MPDLTERLHSAAAAGMTASVWAQEKPDAAAIYDAEGAHSFFDVNANANRIVRLLRAHGCKPGDSVALMCSNRVEFVEVLCATLRAGFRFTPVNWHLTADEVEYIINDCEAKALIAEPRYPAALSAQAPGVSLKVAIGAPAEGFLPYAETLSPFDGSDIDDPLLGGAMLYTSGTTGRPKGVYRAKNAVLVLPTPGEPDDVQMCAGPAYHAAPLAFDVRAAINQGNPLVFLDRWDSERVLETIEFHRVTRAHMVPSCSSACWRCPTR
jgi:long-chain acyl-CoA synthetase